jgi:hypothetical protein
VVVLAVELTLYLVAAGGAFALLHVWPLSGAPEESGVLVLTVVAFAGAAVLRVAGEWPAIVRTWRHWRGDRHE